MIKGDKKVTNLGNVYEYDGDTWCWEGSIPASKTVQEVMVGYEMIKKGTNQDYYRKKELV